MKSVAAKLLSLPLALLVLTASMAADGHVVQETVSFTVAAP